MVKGLYTSAAGMLPRLVQQESIATNLANSSTVGYKKGEIFLRTMIDASSALDHAQGKNWGSRPEDLRTDYTQGSFDQTGNALDIALKGPGFLKVRDTGGNVYYTRDGRFHLNTDGYVENTSGMILLDTTDNPISIQGNELAVTDNGAMQVDGELVTRIGLTDFKTEDYLTLQNVGMGLFRKTNATAELTASADTVFEQGYLEDSNADPISAMVEMIETFRSYEMGQKSIQVQDQSLQRVVQDLGSVK